MKNFWIILGVIVISMIGLVVVSKEDTPESNLPAIENPREEQNDDHVIGAGDKGVTLIEYGDFECPACAQVYPAIKQLESEYGDDIKVIYRHFPLVSLHPNAMAAHRAAEAAGAQGKFWEMHDLLYEGQTTWGARVATFGQAVETFEGYAEELELDLDQYKQDTETQATADFIDRHMDSGRELGFTSTPSLLLNGTELPTPRTYQDLKAAVDEAIAVAAESDSTESTEEKPADEEKPATE